jgi:topoisomerase-4 subunit A
VNFGGTDAGREPMEVDVEEFIAVKGFKARGKRITTLHIDSVVELEPTRFPEPEKEADDEDPDEPENLDPDAGKSEQQIITEITGQQFFQFDDDDM